MIAGMVATAACITETSPLLQWSTAIIAGAGTAGIIQASSVGVRATSTLTTGGLGNFMVSGIELVGSMALSLFALFLPLLTVFAVVGLLLAALTVVVRWHRRRRNPAAPALPPSPYHSAQI